jgi:hypothetical protein
MAGHTNNPNGRPKGTPNKTTAELRELVTNLFESKYEDFKTALDELEPKEKVTAMLKLMEFVLPKQKEVKLDTVELFTDFEIVRHPAHDKIKRRPVSDVGENAPTFPK